MNQIGPSGCKRADMACRGCTKGLMAQKGTQVVCEDV